MVFNLTIASHKLRAFYYRGLVLPTTDPPFIRVHAPGWIPQFIFLKSDGTFKSLGVEYPINPGDSTSFVLIASIRAAVSIKKASARAVNLSYLQMSLCGGSVLLVPGMVRRTGQAICH